MSEPLRGKLSAIPVAKVPPAPALAEGIAHSVQYLASDAAAASLAEEVYWPKWDSPWWHMLLLWEIGEARRIPERAVSQMIAGLAAFPLKTFPITREELGDANPHRDVMCHCGLGSILQVLQACGVDAWAAVPWAEPWFPRYQMADGGLSCDDVAYTVTGECPSSMVGTVAPFEAMMLGGPVAWSAARRTFLANGAAFLMRRALVNGSETAHNAAERTSAQTWGDPCWPRFYFYDVLRGLTALARWAELARASIPEAAIRAACTALVDRFPDGVVHVARQPFAACNTLVAGEDHAWSSRQPASRFPLLDAVSAIGASAHLTEEWTRTRRTLLGLYDAGQIAL